MGADGRVAVTFAGEGGFLVISLLPTEKDFAASHDRAYAVPRDTRLDRKYDREAGQLRTEWVVETAPLRAGAKGVLQGFLPHQWRDNGERLELDGPEFGTIRGVMKCGSGEVFRMSHEFRGGGRGGRLWGRRAGRRSGCRGCCASILRRRRSR